MADLCREFGISRKTGYKIFGRYQECGIQGLTDIDYPLHDKTIVVTRCGRICLGRKKINSSTVFAGQTVGIKEVHDDIWPVSFMDHDLGYFDLETRVLEPLENPFGPKV
jgi:putative transposase